VTRSDFCDPSSARQCLVDSQFGATIAAHMVADLGINGALWLAWRFSDPSCFSTSTTMSGSVERFTLRIQVCLGEALFGFEFRDAGGSSINGRGIQ